MADWVKRAILHHRTKFCDDQSSCCQRMHICQLFAKWQPSAILDSSDAYWDHPQRVLSGLYCCAKLVGIGPVVLIIWMLTLENSGMFLLLDISCSATVVMNDMKLLQMNHVGWYLLSSCGDIVQDIISPVLLYILRMWVWKTASQWLSYWCQFALVSCSSLWSFWLSSCCWTGNGFTQVDLSVVKFHWAC